MNRFGNTLFNFYKLSLPFTLPTSGLLGIFYSHEYLNDIQSKLGNDDQIPYLYKLGNKYQHIFSSMFIFGIGYPISIPHYYYDTHYKFIIKK